MEVEGFLSLQRWLKRVDFCYEKLIHDFNVLRLSDKAHCSFHVSSKRIEFQDGGKKLKFEAVLLTPSDAWSRKWSNFNDMEKITARPVPALIFIFQDIPYIVDHRAMRNISLPKPGFAHHSQPLCPPCYVY